MIYWTQCDKPNNYDVKRYNRVKYDNNIYSFDIETSSYFAIDNINHAARHYKKYHDEKTEIDYRSTMYIWQFSINDQVYYGRTWKEFRQFLEIINDTEVRKIVYVHNLSFEFQFLWSNFEISKVFARKSRKVIYCELEEFNIEFRCSLYLTNASLEFVPGLYDLPVKKLTGNLDYSKIRHSQTYLFKEELDYCEHDCLVVYELIKYYRSIYNHVYRIPRTNTGIVRKEFQKTIRKNNRYKHKILKAYNDDPIVYNFLVKAFAGGYTHANFIYADEIQKNVTSFDEASAYPYHMLSRRYPAKTFKKCYIKDLSRMNHNFAYLMKIRLTNVKSNYYNHFISYSKCYDCYDPILDNGRLVSASSITIYCTDIDIRLYQDSYNFDYEILDIFYSTYEYLPIELTEFLLKIYGEKTILKGEGAKYNIKKSQFNSMYGMCVTNNIRDDVTFNNGEWSETPLSNEQIIEQLQKEKKKAFLSFAWGVWITSYSRDTLCRQIMANDDYVVYCDTDSIKLMPGFNVDSIFKYNESVKSLIETVCKKRDIDINKFYPADKKGVKHGLGFFENEGTYNEFITLGAKKYCYTDDKGLHITVSGVPKRTGIKCLNDISEFKKGLLFDTERTGKLAAYYNDDQTEHVLYDYQGNALTIRDGSGVTLIGSDYTLGMSVEYEDFISSDRALYKEG